MSVNREREREEEEGGVPLCCSTTHSLLSKEFSIIKFKTVEKRYIASKFIYKIISVINVVTYNLSKHGSKVQRQVFFIHSVSVKQTSTRTFFLLRTVHLSMI
jgi:hypothetical protein